VDYTYAAMLSESFLRYSFTRLTEDNTPTRKRVLYFNSPLGSASIAAVRHLSEMVGCGWWFGSGLWEVRQSGSSY